MKKKLLFVFVGIILLSLTTACDSNINDDNKHNDLSNGTNSHTGITITEANSYTELEIFGAKIKFKMANPTYFWDCNYNFGADEIDTIFMVSENGKKLENYRDIENMSMLTFLTSSDVVLSESAIKKQYKNWHNIDVTVENLEHDLYKKTY